MGEQSPEINQGSLSRFQIMKVMGRHALRRVTTWAEYRRERRMSVSELNDLGTMKRNFKVTPAQARIFIAEWQINYEEEDRPEMLPSDAEQQLLVALGDIVGKHEAVRKVIDVVRVINQATLCVEGSWDASDEQYQSGTLRQLYIPMLLAREALFEGIMLAGTQDNTSEM